MKLNPDCIRDILLEIEGISDGVNSYSYRSDRRITQNSYSSNKDEVELQYFPKYDFEELNYHFQQCNLNGYLLDAKHGHDNLFIFKDLTPLGHEFLANIRDDNNWNKIKDSAKSVGSSSLPVLFEIGAKYMASKISNISF